MAVSYQAIGTIDGATNANTAPTMPTHQAGDIIFIVVESANENVGNVTPTGYAAVTTPLGTGTAAGTAATRATVWWKRATSAAETTPSLGDYGDHTIAVIFTARGAVTSGSPIDVSATAVDSAATTAVSCPAVTPTVANTLVVNVFTNPTDAAAAVVSAGPTNANLTSLTKRFDAGNISGNGGGICIVTGSMATAASTGATTATATSTVRSYMTFAVLPDTTAPTITSSATQTVAENTAFSMTLTANETVTWSKLTSPGPEHALFTLSGSTLSMTAKDFEAPADESLLDGTSNTYRVTVRATDIGGNTTDQTITVTVTDVASPTITSTDTGTVAENSTLAKALTVASGTPTWSIVGGADQSKFAISGSTLTWAGNGTKNFEAPDDADTNNIYVVTVRATVNGETTDQTISITVTDIAAPTITSTDTGTVAENSTLAKALTVASGTPTWSIVGGADQAQFAISGSNLTWAANGTKNFEAPNDADANNVYVVTVRATVNGETTDQTISITVTDIAAPTITTSSTQSVISGNTLAVALTVASGSPTWSLAGGVDQAQFAITGSTLTWSANGTRTTASPADSGANNVYDVIVRATISGETTDQAIAVTVQDAVLRRAARSVMVF